MQDEKIWSCGFISNSPNAENFVEKIMTLKNEHPKKLKGKWFIYNEKNGFFNKRIIK